MISSGTLAATGHGFDLMPSAMAELMDEAVPLLLSRMTRPASRTVASLDRAAIETQLPAALPREGGGAARLRQILLEEFLPLVRDYRHPLHLGHQRPAPSFASLYADLAAAAFNPTVTMFEGGPYSVAVEARVLAWMKQLAGFPDDAVATLVNGGAEAHLTALLIARDRALAAGHARENLRLLVGAHAHYTLPRARHILGLPAEAMIEIPARPDLSLDPAALADRLDSLRADGRIVMAIVATAGGTANGAFDDLQSVGRLAQQAGAWFHVDAAHGGAALLSSRHRAKLAGLDAADSVVINPHKLFFVSSPCSVLLCRQRAAFAASLDVGLAQASYVIPDPAALETIADGDEPLRWTIACTRFFSAFRLYAALSAYGTDGLAARLDHACDLARHLAGLVTAAPDFELLAPPTFNMVCFRYRPSAVPAGQLDRLNRRLRDRLAAGSDAYLTGCTAHGAYWLRAQVMSEQVDTQSLARLLPLLRHDADSLLQTEGNQHVQ
ncbi:aspartate aminotransferase family protein [Dongia sp.]|uniref:pyridoxal phosphate-dependent decarboxylase family protein n=1 Tax=Dongia sp. TaxID=1977262 RepID=UPI0035B4BF62